MDNAHCIKFLKRNFAMWKKDMGLRVRKSDLVFHKTSDVSLINYKLSHMLSELEYKIKAQTVSSLSLSFQLMLVLFLDFLKFWNMCFY